MSPADFLFFFVAIAFFAYLKLTCKTYSKKCNIRVMTILDSQYQIFKILQLEKLRTK